MNPLVRGAGRSRMGVAGVLGADTSGLSEDVLTAWIEDASRELAAFADQHSLKVERSAPIQLPALVPALVLPSGQTCHPAKRTHSSVQMVSYLWARSRHGLAGAAAFLTILAVIVGSPLIPHQSLRKGVTLQSLPADPPVIRTIAVAEAQEPTAEQESKAVEPLAAVEEAFPR